MACSQVPLKKRIGVFSLLLTLQKTASKAEQVPEKEARKR